MTTPTEQALEALASVLANVEGLNTVIVPDLSVFLPPDPVALGGVLARLRKGIKEMQDCATLIEDEMVKCMPGKTVEVPGVGTAEMHSGAKRTAWNKEGLRDVLAHVIAADIPPMWSVDEDGEAGDAVNHVEYVKQILDAYTTAATPSFKVTGLRAMQIDPGDWCETAWGRKTIQMPGLGYEQKEQDG